MSPARGSRRHRGLVMPQGRRIPRPPTPRPPRPAAPDPPEGGVSRELLEKAGGELTDLASRVRSCEACGRACPDRVAGTGSPRAPLLLLKEHPGEADLETGGAFAEEAEALQLAFDRLGTPFSWAYGTTAVRCGPGPASGDEVKACAPHLLVELEAVRPSVLVVFGGRAWDALRALDGCCGLAVPDEVPRGEPVGVRSGLVALLTEPLPDGVRATEAKRRLWADLRRLPGLLDQPGSGDEPASQ